MAVDLDGTLVRGNTLHEYIRCGLRHGGIRSRLRILAALTLRRLRVSSHVAMKRRVLAAIRPDAAFVADFRGRVDAMRRPEVDALMRRHREAGGIVVLATAASELYVPLIWDGDSVSTDARCAVECRGAEKLRRVLSYAEARGARLDTVVTDHPDDMPLLARPGVRRVIVGAHPGLAGVSADLRMR